jgi:predicted ATP-binding protein involved in virulence
MENNSIIDIHERVYAHLIKNHPELRFTLRQIDRGERLSKGFWFTGNDSYLAFSFWQGTDWRNKTSNIFFSIDKDGTSWLNFVANDDDENGKKSNFLRDVAEVIGMFKRPRRNDNPTKQEWIKKYPSQDYIKSLDDFIIGDKKVIDSSVKVGNATFFSQIEALDFKRWKERIEKVREKFDSGTAHSEKTDIQAPKLVRLKKISLDNISIFKSNQSLSFNNRLTCIIGWNGSGKTSLLRSIVLGFTGFEQDESISSNDDGKLDRLQDLLKITGELENSKGDAKYAPTGSINLSYNINGIESPLNEVLFKTENNKVQIRDAGKFDSINDKIYVNLFIAFPQKQGGNEDESKEKLPNVEDTKAMLYREPDNRFQKFAAWLRTINTKSDKKILNKESNAKEQNLLKTAFEIINRVTNLSNNDDLDKNVSLHKIVFTDGINDPIWVKIGKNTEPIPLELISDGYNNIFGWTGYLITRLSEVADVLNVENFMDVPAIVLIDEIDTYLHPQWQSRILAVLVDMFPNIQFVVTTHSPYVVGSVPQNLMSLYVCKEGTIREFKDFIPYGADIERLTRQIFDAPVRANAVSIKIDKLRSAIQQASVQDDSLNVDKLFKDLEDIGIGNDENDNDPEIGSLKFFWRTKKRKLGI